MQIRKKSQNELNSQAMSYAAYEVSSWDKKGEISDATTKDLGGVASHELYPDYVKHLRKNKEFIDMRTELQNRYDTDFKSIVDPLLATIVDTDKSKQHDAYLGEGGTAQAFAIESSGKEYVVRRIRFEGPDMLSVDGYTAGALQVRGIPHFEQMVAISYEDKVTISERMPGGNPKDIKPEDMWQISDVQLQDFIETLQAAQENNILIDPNPNNFLYDADEGFGLIDLGSALVKSHYGEMTLGGKIVESSEMILEMGDDTKIYNFTHRDEEGYYYEKNKLETARLGVLNRFRTAIDKADMPQVDRDLALTTVDSYIRSTESRIQSYSNPAWIQSSIQDAAGYIVAPVWNPEQGVQGWDVATNTRAGARQP